LDGAFHKKLNFWDRCFPKYNFGKRTQKVELDESIKLDKLDKLYELYKLTE